MIIIVIGRLCLNILPRRGHSLIEILAQLLLLFSDSSHCESTLSVVDAAAVDRIHLALVSATETQRPTFVVVVVVVAVVSLALPGAAVAAFNAVVVVTVAVAGAEAASESQSSQARLETSWFAELTSFFSAPLGRRRRRRRRRLSSHKSARRRRMLSSVPSILRFALL